jgi:hypothetical protein
MTKLLLIALIVVTGIIFIFRASEKGNNIVDFYDTINYKPDKGRLSFTIPKDIPKGYKFYLHVSGRLFMGDKSSGMSFHAFDKESQNYSWERGKTYTYNVSAENLDFIMLDFGLVDNLSNEFVYEYIINISADGAKTIYKADSLVE